MEGKLRNNTSKKKIVLFWAKFEMIAKNIIHDNSFINSILDVMQLVNSIQKLTPFDIILFNFF